MSGVLKLPSLAAVALLLLCAAVPAGAVKFYIGLEADLMEALAREAHRQGLQVWAHAVVFPAHQTGVPVAAGSDFYAPEGEDFPALHLELERLVDSGVMTPSEALIAATLTGARAPGRGADYGTIEPGKLAGMVLLREDPTVDIRALRTVEAVIKRGRIHSRTEYTPGPPRGDRQPSDTVDSDPYPEVRAAQTAMAEAMAAADCDSVAGFFADDFTFYARGRHLDSRETVVGRCRQVPRPFPETQHLVDEIRVLSGSTALALQVMELHRDGPDRTASREVITRLWIRSDDGRWRISHMHVSLDEVPDP